MAEEVKVGLSQEEVVSVKDKLVSELNKRATNGILTVTDARSNAPLLLTLDNGG